MKHIAKEYRVHMGGRINSGKAEVWIFESGDDEFTVKFLAPFCSDEAYDKAFLRAIINFEGLDMTGMHLVIKLREHHVESCENVFTELGIMVAREIKSIYLQ